MIWIATGLILSSVNRAFTCNRTNQGEIIRHVKMFPFHPFLNIWYFLSDILSDIPINTLSDSCSAASEYLRLNLIPLESPRKSLKCLAHIADLLEKHAFVKLSLITGFTKKLAAHFSKPSWLAKDTNNALRQARSNRRFLYSTGEQFFFHGQNALIAYLEFDNLKQIVSETAPSSNGSEAIMKKEELKIQLAISASLTCPIPELWSNLTKTTTRRDNSSTRTSRK